MNRRTFINGFFGGSLLATLASFLYPVIRYILPPKQAEAVQKKVAAAKIGDLAPNSAKIFKFGSSPAILINTQDGKLLAFAATCTHLTCTVTYQGETETMFCPKRGNGARTRRSVSVERIVSGYRFTPERPSWFVRSFPP